ncbi:hypothetical protein U9M48_037065 [Paspalum notatum var. saurae]|uniref:Uncharacterized protein n=1 Tax=Paspalum notatum var. saurae TaxID=547442 RepID=A0AAQ3UGB0_PASNO
MFASLLQASGRRVPCEDADAVAPLLPRLGLGATAPPPLTAAAAGMIGAPGASSSPSLLQAVGRGGLLPRLGATVPRPPAAAGVGSGVFSLQAVGRRLPQEGGLGLLLPRLGAPKVPSSATPWRFHQMAGVCSSADAGEQLACDSEEYMETIHNLDTKIKAMEDRMKLLENMWWVIVGLGIYMVVTLAEPMIRLWAMNSQIASRLRAAKESAKQIDEGISQYILKRLKLALCSFIGIDVIR